MIAKLPKYLFSRYLAALAMLALLVFSQCTNKVFKEFFPLSPEMRSSLSVFSPDSTTFIYRTNVSIYGQELSGLMVLKKLMERDSYRVVFLSEIGMKYFDFEFSNGIKADAFEVHYCMEALQREQIMNHLENNIRMLVMNYPEDTSITYFENSSNGDMGLSYGHEGKTNAYLFSKDQAVYHILRQSKTQTICSIHLQTQKGKGAPDRIEIHNRRPKLNMLLTRINQ